MNESDYFRELESLKKRLSGEFPKVSIIGAGAGAFISVENGIYGAEIYRSDDGYVVDPALYDELQGEIEFTTKEEAVNEAIAWLKRG